MASIPTLQEWRAFDQARADLPAEHCVVAALGLALVLAGLRADRRGSAVLRAAIGGALLLRAASGRGGLAKLLEPAARPAWDAHLEDARALGLD